MMNLRLLSSPAQHAITYNRNYWPLYIPENSIMTKPNIFGPMKSSHTFQYFIIYFSISDSMYTFIQSSGLFTLRFTNHLMPNFPSFGSNSGALIPTANDTARK